MKEHTLLHGHPGNELAIPLLSVSRVFPDQTLDEANEVLSAIGHRVFATGISYLQSLHAGRLPRGAVCAPVCFTPSLPPRGS